MQQNAVQLPFVHTCHQCSYKTSFCQNGVVNDTNIKDKPVILSINDKKGTNIEFQLSKLTAYPNTGVSQRGLDNQGWTAITQLILTYSAI